MFFFYYSSKYIIKTTAKEIYTRNFSSVNAPTANVVRSPTKKIGNARDNRFNLKLKN